MKVTLSSLLTTLCLLQVPIFGTEQQQTFIIQSVFKDNQTLLDKFTSNGDIPVWRVEQPKPVKLMVFKTPSSIVTIKNKYSNKTIIQNETKEEKNKTTLGDILNGINSPPEFPPPPPNYHQTILEVVSQHQDLLPAILPLIFGIIPPRPWRFTQGFFKPKSKRRPMRSVFEADVPETNSTSKRKDIQLNESPSLYVLRVVTKAGLYFGPKLHMDQRFRTFEEVSAWKIEENSRWFMQYLFYLQELALKEREENNDLLPPQFEKKSVYLFHIPPKRIIMKTVLRWKKNLTEPRNEREMDFRGNLTRMNRNAKHNESTSDIFKEVDKIFDKLSKNYDAELEDGVKVLKKLVKRFDHLLTLSENVLIVSERSKRSLNSIFNSVFRPENYQKNLIEIFLKSSSLSYTSTFKAHLTPTLTPTSTFTPVASVDTFTPVVPVKTLKASNQFNGSITFALPRPISVFHYNKNFFKSAHEVAIPSFEKANKFRSKRFIKFNPIFQSVFDHGDGRKLQEKFFQRAPLPLTFWYKCKQHGIYHVKKPDGPYTFSISEFGAPHGFYVPKSRKVTSKENRLKENNGFIYGVPIKYISLPTNLKHTKSTFQGNLQNSVLITAGPLKVPNINHLNIFRRPHAVYGVPKANLTLSPSTVEPMYPQNIDLYGLPKQQKIINFKKVQELVITTTYNYFIGPSKTLNSQNKSTTSSQLASPTTILSPSTVKPINQEKLELYEPPKQQKKSNNTQSYEGVTTIDDYSLEPPNENSTGSKVNSGENKLIPISEINIAKKNKVHSFKDMVQNTTKAIKAESKVPKHQESPIIITTVFFNTLLAPREKKLLSFKSTKVTEGSINLESAWKPTSVAKNINKSADIVLKKTDISPSIEAGYSKVVVTTLFYKTLSVPSDRKKLNFNITKGLEATSRVPNTYNAWKSKSIAAQNDKRVDGIAHVTDAQNTSKSIKPIELQDANKTAEVSTRVPSTLNAIETGKSGVVVTMVFYNTLLLPREKKLQIFKPEPSPQPHLLKQHKFNAKSTETVFNKELFKKSSPDPLRKNMFKNNATAPLRIFFDLPESLQEYDTVNLSSSLQSSTDTGVSGPQLPESLLEAIKYNAQFAVHSADLKKSEEVTVALHSVKKQGVEHILTGSLDSTEHHPLKKNETTVVSASTHASFITPVAVNAVVFQQLPSSVKAYNFNRSALIMENLAFDIINGGNGLNVSKKQTFTDKAIDVDRQQTFNTTNSRSKERIYTTDHSNTSLHYLNGMKQINNTFFESTNIKFSSAKSSMKVSRPTKNFDYKMSAQLMDALNKSLNMNSSNGATFNENKFPKRQKIKTATFSSSSVTNANSENSSLAQFLEINLRKLNLVQRMDSPNVNSSLNENRYSRTKQRINTTNVTIHSGTTTLNLGNSSLLQFLETNFRVPKFKKMLNFTMSAPKREPPKVYSDLNENRHSRKRQKIKSINITKYNKFDNTNVSNSQNSSQLEFMETNFQIPKLYKSFDFKISAQRMNPPTINISLNENRYSTRRQRIKTTNITISNIFNGTNSSNLENSLVQYLERRVPKANKTFDFKMSAQRMDSANLYSNLYGNGYSKRRHRIKSNDITIANKFTSTNTSSSENSSLSPHLKTNLIEPNIYRAFDFKMSAQKLNLHNMSSLNYSRYPRKRQRINTNTNITTFIWANASNLINSSLVQFLEINFKVPKINKTFYFKMSAQRMDPPNINSNLEENGYSRRRQRIKTNNITISNRFIGANTSSFGNSSLSQIFKTNLIGPNLKKTFDFKMSTQKIDSRNINNLNENKVNNQGVEIITISNGTSTFNSENSSPLQFPETSLGVPKLKKLHDFNSFSTTILNEDKILGKNRRIKTTNISIVNKFSATNKTNSSLVEFLEPSPKVPKLRKNFNSKFSLPNSNSNSRIETANINITNASNFSPFSLINNLTSLKLEHLTPLHIPTRNASSRPRQNLVISHLKNQASPPLSNLSLPLSLKKVVFNNVVTVLKENGRSDIPIEREVIVLSKNVSLANRESLASTLLNRARLRGTVGKVNVKKNVTNLYSISNRNRSRFVFKTKKNNTSTRSESTNSPVSVESSTATPNKFFLRQRPQFVKSPKTISTFVPLSKITYTITQTINNNTRVIDRGTVDSSSKNVSELVSKVSLPPGVMHNGGYATKDIRLDGKKVLVKVRKRPVGRTENVVAQWLDKERVNEVKAV